MSQVNFVYLTKERLVEIEKVLKEMKTNGRKKMAEKIATARAHGDLSENAEYDAAKEAQGLLETKIAQLKNVVANARIIDESQLDDSKVLILSKVKIKNVKSGMELSYTLVAENEADLKAGKISIDSPIGKGLLGKEVGDIADIEVPNGIMQFEILNISR